MNAFGLRDDELSISFLMLLYIFIIITVLLIVKPTVNALFVSTLGAENLPFGYLLVAVTAVLASYFYNSAIRVFSLVRVAVISLITFSLSFFILGVFLKYTFINNWILYAYYVLISLFAVVATSQFWLLANMVFNAREARRNFGFIGAGAIAGGIFGGYLTSIIASSFGNEFAIFLAALFLLICIPILKSIWTLKIQYLTIFKRKKVISNQERLENSSLRVISKSKHLIYIASITGIGVIVAKLVDFQFSDFADKAISDPDDLAAFFGFWFSTFNVVALVIQLFFTNRVLTRLGVSSTLLILPLSIALGGLLFLTFPELWVLVLIKGIDGSAKQSLNKAAVELSIMPIPLLEKNQAKSYIDVVVDSIAAGFAGFLLIFLIKKLDLDSTYITVIILLFTFIWILFIYRLREAYFNSFKLNIKNSLFSDTKSNKKLREENTISDVKNILENGDETAILNMLNRLKEYKQTAFSPRIIKLLDHPSNKIKAKAIKNLDAFENLDILEKIETLVFEKDPFLVNIALNYVLRHTPTTETLFFKKYLDHQEEIIRNGALLSLAKVSSNNARLAEQYHLIDRLEREIPILTSEDIHTKKEILSTLLISIALARLSPYYIYIQIHLKSESGAIAKSATIAAGIASDEVFINDLLDLLENRKHRKKAIKALKEYGPKIMDSILQIEKNNELKRSIRKYIPKVIESFNNDQAAKILLKLLRSKNAITRLEASVSLKKLRKNNDNIQVGARIIKTKIVKESKYYKKTLEIINSIQSVVSAEIESETVVSNKLIFNARKQIIISLEELLENNLKCIFNLLSLIYNEEDISMTFVGIKSEIKEARINSLEFLDNILESKIKMSVLPLIENYVVNDAHFSSKTIDFELLTEEKYLLRVMEMGGSHLKILVIKYIGLSKNKAYISLLLPLSKFKNSEVKELATSTHQKLISYQG